MKTINPLPIHGSIVVTVKVDTSVGEYTRKMCITQDEIDTNGADREEILSYQSGKAAAECMRHIAYQYVRDSGYAVDTKEGSFLWRCTSAGRARDMREPGDSNDE